MEAIQSFLEENLSYIRRYHKNTDAISNENLKLEDFKFETSRKGTPVLYYQGLALNSLDDPILEAQNLVREILDKDNENAIHILIGIGTGYDFKVFTQNLQGKIILLELRLEILKFILEVLDFSDELSLRNVCITTCSPELIEAFSAAYTKNCNVTFTMIKGYKQVAPKLEEDLKKIIEEIIPVEYNGGPLKLNIGPGKWFKKDWKRLDCYTNLTNFNIDLRKMTHLPLEDNVLEKVFSSHCIEHIEDKHLDILIKELYRTMQPGGILRFSCPDADQALEAYRIGDKKWFSWLPQNTIGKMLINSFVSYESGGPDVPDMLVKEKFETLEREEFIRWCLSQADRTRPYIAHINGHYFDKLYKKFDDAGFVNISRSTYRGSEDEELRGEMFDLYPEFSLYIECRKPEV